MELKGDQAFSLASGSVNQLSVQKKGSMDLQPVHVERVEISPTICCFEWEGDQEFLAGDEIDFQFDLEDFSLTTKGAIVRFRSFRTGDFVLRDLSHFTRCKQENQMRE